MSTQIEKWATQIRDGEIRAISRAITAIENHAPEAEPDDEVGATTP